MKRLLISVLTCLVWLAANSQVAHKTVTKHTTTTATSTTKSSANKSAGNDVRLNTTAQPQPMQSTASGTSSSASANKTSEQTTTKPAPFDVGIHPAKDAAKTFDTLHNNTTGAVQQNNNTGVNTSIATDTMHNINTNINNSVNTTSGAVDRSGQAQFGQANWGRNSRNTIGESQWTVPPPITSTFKKDYPDASGITWSRNSDSIYSARYRFDNSWSTSTYNTAGELMSTHTEIPLVQAPRPVSVYLANQPSTLRLTSIARVQTQGRPDLYEIKTSTGRTIYVTNDGAETNMK